MKVILRRLAIVALIVTSATSCTTVYDEYGRPREMVDPGAAVLGAAAVGLLAYGLSESHHDHRGYRDDYRGGGYYGRPRHHHHHGY